MQPKKGVAQNASIVTGGSTEATDKADELPFKSFSIYAFKNSLCWEILNNNWA